MTRRRRVAGAVPVFEAPAQQDTPQTQPKVGRVSGPSVSRNEGLR